MGTPAHTARVAPVGRKLEDGHSTIVTFSADPDVSFWEQAVTPPGIDGGEPIPSTTMHNVTWRTMVPRSLKTLTPMTLTAAYDPRVYDQIVSLINVQGSVSILFSDSSYVDFFGYLQKFEPQQLTEGAQPLVQITIVPTNTDPSDGTEAGPNYVTASGTD